VAGDDADLRLVVELELLLVDRLSQLVFERQPLGDFAAHLELVVQVLFAGFLGMLERCFGLLHQRAAVLSVDGIVRHAGAAGDANAAALDQKRLSEYRAVEQRGGALVRGADDRRDEHEGTAPQVAHALVAAGVEPEPLGHFLQQHVAEMPAEAVVEIIEVIDIEHGHRRRLSGAKRACSNSSNRRQNNERLAKPVKGS